MRLQILLVMIMRVATIALLFPSVLGMAASPEPDTTLTEPTEDIFIAASIGEFDPMDDFVHNENATSWVMQFEAGLEGTECARPVPLPPSSLLRRHAATSFPLQVL